jgi:glycyl-tRNA synthetase
MVIEMTSLQGIMGRFYALHSGESAEVAQAISEQYSTAPASKAGLVIGAADRLDTLAGLFSAGLAPSGTKDPFAQRRAALGLVQALIGSETAFDLRLGLALAAEGLPIPAAADTLEACLDFVVGRLRTHLLEEGGFRYDVVDAVLAAQAGNPLGAWNAARELTAWIERPVWNELLPAYARCVRITRDQKEKFAIQPAAFADPAENALFQAVKAVEEVVKAGSVESLFQAFQPVIPVINRFFEAVLVMAEDPAVRSNRLGLLQRVAALADGTLDLSKLEGF